MRQLFRPGDKLTAESLNNILPTTLRSIYAGPGIRILPNGAGISISAIAQPRRGGGGASSGSDIQTAKLKSLDAGGNTMTVYLWDSSVDNGEDPPGAWSTTETTVFKPFILMPASFLINSLTQKTITYTDGTERTYNITSLDAKFQRRCKWTDSESNNYEEIQEITSPYFPNEILRVESVFIPDAQRASWGLPYAGDGPQTVLIDTNRAGRDWGRVEILEY
jgi:hypothetical protein